MEAFNLGVKSAVTKLLQVSDEFFLAEDKAEQKGNFKIKFLYFIMLFKLFRFKFYVCDKFSRALRRSLGPNLYVLNFYLNFIGSPRILSPQAWNL